MEQSQEQILARLRQHLIEEERRQLSQNANLISEFKEFSLKRGVALQDSNFMYIEPIGIVASYPNLLCLSCPEIIEDKEGLVVFGDLCNMFERMPFAPGYFYGKKFMVMAHPYFRRSFHDSANFAPDFVRLFWGTKFNNIDSYIALDCNRVRINVDSSMYMERDTWFGAKFSENISDIPDGIIKLRPPLDISKFTNDFMFASSYSLDIKWETKNAIKSFQAEEFKTEEETVTIDGTIFCPVRYLHAEFDLEKNTFRHFDGAIHLYTVDEYFVRRDADFNYNVKHSSKIKSNSRKLFKLNGEVHIPMWIEFISHFLTGNPLVMEYFEGKYPDHVTDMLDAIRKSKI